MSVPWLDAAALRERLTFVAAADALEAAFAAPDGRTGPERTNLAVPDGELLLMPASGAEGVGVKLVTITPANAQRGLPFIHGIYALFAPGTQAPEALIDGAAITGLRTAAVTAMATRRLAREDVRRLVVFGAGAQAAPHVEAMLAVRPSIERVEIVGRSPERVDALVAQLAGQGLDARAAGPEAVREADLVCTCTTSAEPLFPATWVAPGAHVNAVGAYRTDRRELDGPLLRDALLIVESRESALAEAGDIVLAMREGLFDERVIDGDLTELVTGRVGRSSPEQVTVFKSVGLAVEDLVIARAALAAG